MDDRIELKGYWWLPDSPQSKLPGSLVFSQDEGAVLDTVGVFGREQTARIEQPDIILGVTQHGEAITLYKCILIQVSLMAAVRGVAKYFAHLVFEGVHFEAEEQVRLSELYGSYSELDSWVNISGFTIECDHEDENPVWKITYEKPLARWFAAGDDIEVGVAFSSDGPNLSMVQSEISITQRAYLAVKSRRGDVSFNELFAKLDTFTCLLAVASGRIPRPISVMGYSSKNVQFRGSNREKAYHPEIAIYYQAIERGRRRERQMPQKMLFTFGDLTVEQVGAWFGVFSRYEAAIQLYKSLFYSDRLFIDTKFLHIAEALESLYGILFKDQYSSDVRYTGLRVRIFELLDKKKQLLGECVSDVGAFAARVRDTRNEFVHHNKKPLTFQKEELPSAIDLLKLLFETYLLEIIGFSDEKTRELMESRIQTHVTGWVHLRGHKPSATA